MTPEETREELRTRLDRAMEGRLSSVTSFARAKDLSTKGEHQQKRKCTQCGKTYLGQANSSTCGDACRQAKSRA